MSTITGISWRVNYGELSDRLQFRLGQLRSEAYDAYFPIGTLSDLITTLTGVAGLGIGQLQLGVAVQARKAQSGTRTTVVVEPRSDTFPPQIFRYDFTDQTDIVTVLTQLQASLSTAAPDDWDFSDVPSASTIKSTRSIVNMADDGSFVGDTATWLESGLGAGYDIVVLAGQSNMSGRGTPYAASTDPANARIDQWGTHGTLGIKPAAEPLDMHDTPSGIGPGLQFARWYAARRLLKNRKVLLVPTAHGGTPLVSSAVPLSWRRGVTGNLYANMITQTQAALAAADAIADTTNRVVAFLWIQGETDGDANTTGAAYRTDLDAVLNGVRTDLGISDLPIILGGMVPEYLGTGSRSQINAIHLDTPFRITRCDIAPGVSGANLGDGNHYNAAGQRTMGKNMFDAYDRAFEGLMTTTGAALTTPGQVTGLATGVIGATSVGLSWAALPGASTYLVEYRVTGAGPWTAGVIATGTTATQSGLTSTTGYDFRVTGQNTGGIGGTASATVTATTLTPQYALGVTSVSPAGVYSLRKVVSTYGGSAVKVRRSSDNTTQSIGFASGALDTTALLAFVGAGDGFVDTLYDQSGNGFDLNQSTTTAQPKIVAAGSIVTSGGKPAMTFDGTDDVLYRATGLGLFDAASVTACQVLSGNNVGGTQRRVWTESLAASSGNQYGLLQPDIGNGKVTPLMSVGTTSGGIAGTSVAGSAVGFNGSIHQMSGTDNGSAMAQWVDAASDLAATAYVRPVPAFTTPDRFAIGGVVRSGSLAPLAMAFSELVLWAAVLNTTDRQTAEANQKAFYGTP